SPFDVDPELLFADAPAELAVTESACYQAQLVRTLDALGDHLRIEWSGEIHANGRTGTAWISGRRAVATTVSPEHARQHPFAIKLRSHGAGLVLLQVTSPIGRVRTDDEDRIKAVFRLQTKLATAKISAVVNSKDNSYDLTAEVEVPFYP